MNTKKVLVAVLALVSLALPAKAQYYEIANQLTNILSPALSGSLKYRGFVDLKGVAGMGENRANFVGISTTQGFQYASWFFMGAGVGIDMAKGQEYGIAWQPDGSGQGYYSRESSKTKAMIPVFSDFRFNIPGGKAASFFIDLKLGAAWLLGNSDLQLHDTQLTTGTQFYFVPSAGVRIPTNNRNPRQAFNIALAYQLLTSNNSYSHYNAPTLSSLGLTIGFEW